MWIMVNVDTYRENASPCAVGALCLAVTKVPKSILPIFRESDRRLRERISSLGRDHERSCCDV